jgi:hypothetical protein
LVWTVFGSERGNLQCCEGKDKVAPVHAVKAGGRVGV